MNRMLRLLSTLLLATLLALPAAAVPVLQLRPLPGKLHGPGLLQIDVLLNGLGSSAPGTQLAGFSMAISFDDDLLFLRTADTLFGPALGGPADPSQTLNGVDDTVPGSAMLFNLSLLEGSATGCVFCTGPYLDELQGDSLRLATLFFDVQPSATTGPFTFLSIGDLALADAFGESIGDVQIVNALIPIGEPPVLALAGLAFAVACLARRRRGAAATGRGQ